tara:strand:- start:19797 stop:20048 length:252 start_codon:yes stop_codon:yes gene_type:complete
MGHLQQQVVKDDNNVRRFKENTIVKRLLRDGPWDMLNIQQADFSDGDLAQFAELIGCTVACYAELPYVTDEQIKSADAAAAKL